MWSYIKSQFSKQYAWIKKRDTSADLVCKITTKEQPAGTSLPLKTLEQWPYQRIRWKGNRGFVNEAPRGHKWSQIADPVHKCSNRFVLNCARVGWAFSFAAFVSLSFSCFRAVFVHSGSSFRRAWPLDSDRSVCSLAPWQTGSSFLTRRCNSVLPGGLVVAQGEQHGLDGSNEDSGQTTVENHVKQQNFDCEWKKRLKKSKKKVSPTVQRHSRNVGIWHSHVKHLKLK